MNPSHSPHAACCVCQATERRTAFHVNRIDVIECQRCGHRFADLIATADHVTATYSDEYFFGGGAGYQDYTSEREMLRNRGRYFARLMKPYSTAGKLLDVGAAAGYLAQGFADCGWHVQGIEPNQSMVQLAQESKLDVHHAALDEFETSDRFDLITLIQVIAHLPNPHEAMGRVSALLRPGGYCLIETWNRRSWTARLLGKHWHEYSPPSVLNFFSRDGLDQLCSRHGLRTVKHTRPRKWIKGSHAKSLLRYKLGSGMVARLATPMFWCVPNQLSIPYPAEDLFCTIYQKQV